MAGGRERRRFTRIDLSTRIRAVFPGTKERRELLTSNLSEGGLFIRSDAPKPIGTKLHFRFSVRDEGETIEGTGVVTWVEKSGGRGAGMGIKFVTLNEAGRNELKEILRKKKGSARRNDL